MAESKAKNVPAKTPRKRGPKPKPVPAKQANQILELMSKHGKSMRQACVAVGITSSTFIDWVNKDRELAEQYAKAREELMDHIADETMMIADEEFREHEVFEYDEDGNVVKDADGKPVKVKKLVPVDVQRSRLRVDTRKWLLSKLAPKKYGDKTILAGDDDNPIAIAEITRKVVKTQ